MNATETAKICDAISRIKPAQRFDDETPAFWALILANVRYEDARQAVLDLGGKPRYIEPSDILTEVSRIKDDRLDRTEIPTPNADPDDVHAYLAEQRALLAEIRDGLMTGDRLDAYRRGEISPTGRPALTGPMSDPNPDTGPAIVREVLERRRQAEEATAAARAEARAAEEAERARQLAELTDRYPEQCEVNATALDEIVHALGLKAAR